MAAQPIQNSLTDVANALTPEIFTELTRRTNRLQMHSLDSHLLGSHAFIRVARGIPRKFLGMLDKLEDSLLLQIISEFDLNALASFRLVNRRAASFVDNLTEYKTILQLVPNAIRGSYLTQIHNGPSYKVIYEKLFTSRCDQCNEIGQMLYLLTGTRLCYLCLCTDDRYLPMDRTLAIQRFGLTEEIASKLPSMKGLELTTPDALYLPHRVDRRHAYEAGIALHGSAENMHLHVGQQYIQDVTSSRFYEPPSPAGLAFLTQSTNARLLAFNLHARQRAPHPAPWILNYDRSLLVIRTAAAIHFPSFDRATLQPDEICRCLACADYNDHRYHWSREYNRETFERHLRDDVRDGTPTQGSHSWILLSRFNNVM